ncbi:MAG: glycosyltransferase, partial [Flavobacteriaceae bacterium]|nr:glycosyltransferase [Flavobacteriaceae bacterium]
MKYVVVSVTNDLVTDQRVHRTCKTLKAMGFRVLLIGRKLSHSPSVKREYKTIRMRLLFNTGFCFYAGYNLRLFFRLLFTRKDILLANDLDTLLPNFLISRIFRKKLVFDSHELFSEIPELIGRKPVQSFWLQLERFLIPKVKYGLTTSESIANYYDQQYGVTFEVIRNIPDHRKSKIQEFPFPVNGKKIILYQGALNMGRGLELMIDAMQYVENAVFIMIGGGDIVEQLKDKVDSLNLNAKVRFLGRRSPEELNALTPGADLGISLEEDLGLNYRYALPNKLFDYITAK